jgi:hypothetical protein
VRSEAGRHLLLRADPASLQCTLLQLLRLMAAAEDAWWFDETAGNSIVSDDDDSE